MGFVLCECWVPLQGRMSLSMRTWRTQGRASYLFDSSPAEHVLASPANTLQLPGHAGSEESWLIPLI